MLKASRAILDFYKNNSVFTRLHVFIRLKTCPFLEVEKFVPKAGVIVDYGCGHGVFAHILSQTSANRVIYALDICEARINEAEKALGNGKNLKFINIKEAHSIISQADCLVMLDVLCYFRNEEKLKFLKYLYENLKPRASLVIKEISKECSLNFLLLYLQEKIAVSILRITRAKCLNFYTIKDSLLLLKNAGFKVTPVDLTKNHFYPHFLYVCVKE